MTYSSTMLLASKELLPLYPSVKRGNSPRRNRPHPIERFTQHFTYRSL